MPTYSSGLSAGYRLDLILSTARQEISNNRSLVNWELRITRVSGGLTANSSYQNPWSATINGQNFSGTKTYNFNSYSYLTLGSGQVWVGHNADGTKTMSASGSFTDVYSANYVGDGSVSASYGLATIPRASKPTMSPNPVDVGVATTINTNRASASFTHKVQYVIGAKSGTIGGVVGGTISWTPPMDLMTEFPSAESATVQIRVWTYSSSTQNDSTYVGYNTANLTVRAPATAVPSFTAATFSEGNSVVGTAGIGAYVQGVSQLAYTFSGFTGVHGSTAKSYKVTIGTVSGTSTTNTGLTPEIPTSGTVDVVATVTDSRNRSFSRTYQITVLAYTPPQVPTFGVVRALSDGALAEDGTYIKATLGANVSSLLVGGVQKNNSTYLIRTRQTGTSTWTTKVNPAATTATSINATQTFGTYPGGQSFEVEVIVSDRFKSQSVTRIISIATIFQHWDGNLGMGLGKYRTQGMLDVKGQIFQNDGKAVVDDAMLAGGSASIPSAVTATTGTYVYNLTMGSAKNVSGSGGGILISVPGVYLVAGVVDVTNSTSNVVRSAIIRVNSTDVVSLPGSALPGSTTRSIGYPMTTVVLDAGDIVRLVTTASSAGTAHSGARLTVVRIGS